MNPTELIELAADNQWALITAAVIALVVIVLLGWAGVRALRMVGKPADRLTLLAALVATGVAATGMWQFFEAELSDLPIVLRVAFFGFIELAVLTSAVRARQNIREDPGAGAGLDGAAVWALTTLSAVLSTLEADNVQVAVLRLATPFVAAWLWERGLAVERRKHNGQSRDRQRVYWRFTRERILVRLGLADPADRQISEVAAHQRVTAVALAAHHAHLVAHSWFGWRKKRAQRRLRQAMNAAIEHAGLATDRERQRTLLAQIGALSHAANLADASLPAPWSPVLADLAHDHTAADQPEVAHANEVLKSWASLWNPPAALDSTPKMLFGGSPPRGGSDDPHPTFTAGHRDPNESTDRGHSDPDDPTVSWSGGVTLPSVEGSDNRGHRPVPLNPAQGDLAGVTAELARLAHDSERIRWAIDALGPNSSAADVVAWLAERGCTVTLSNATTVLKRHKRAAAKSRAA
ncbi:hypothetical protein [Nonomuraea dietziae]|uniref:hypothetical protein n=1 Tax=Nonomuraea dietziae TaxID=65515 RepID=UPI003445D0BE